MAEPDLGSLLFRAGSPDKSTFALTGGLTVVFLAVVLRWLLKTEGAICLLPILLFPVLAFVWVAPVRLEVFERGVRVRNLMGTRTLRFADMLSYDLKSVQLVHFPIGRKLGMARRRFVFRTLQGRGPWLVVTTEASDEDPAFQRAMQVLNDHRTHWKRG